MSVVYNHRHQLTSACRASWITGQCKQLRDISFSLRSCILRATALTHKGREKELKRPRRKWPHSSWWVDLKTGRIQIQRHTVLTSCMDTVWLVLNETRSQGWHIRTAESFCFWLSFVRSASHKRSGSYVVTNWTGVISSAGLFLYCSKELQTPGTIITKMTLRRKMRGSVLALVCITVHLQFICV